MLVLTRKVGEAVMVGSLINLKVLEVRKGSVKLGIEAPDHVPIYRHEIYLRIRDENRGASSVLPDEIVTIAGNLKLRRADRGTEDGGSA